MVSTSDIMMKANTIEILARLDQLRTELIELAYTLDSRGQLAAADVASTTAARIGELCEELAPGRPVSLVEWLDAAARWNEPPVASGEAPTPRASPA